MDGGSPCEKKKWCGDSVLDLNIVSATQLSPSLVPASRYLKEVVLGLQGYGGTEAKSRGRVDKMSKLLGEAKQAALPVAQTLFWMSIGIIFGRIHDDALADYRNQLAQGWYLLSLEVLKDASKEPEMRDWILNALPFVLAQVIYRLLCDTFEEDRKNFVGQADELLNKLSLVAHFEVTGFQITNETVRKERIKLFSSSVLSNPQIDLFESSAAKKRMEALDKSAAGHVGALTFGNRDGHPLEEMQMEYVMQGRSDPRDGPDKQFRGMSPGASRSPGMLAPGVEPLSPKNRSTRVGSFDNSTSIATEQVEPTNKSMHDLNLEKYDAMAGRSEAMWGRHFGELNSLLSKLEGIGAEEETTNDTLQEGNREDLLSDDGYDGRSASPCSSSPKNADRASPPSSPKSGRSRPSPIRTNHDSGNISSPTPINRGNGPMSPGMGNRHNMDSSLRAGTVVPSREPLVRDAPRNIQIAGNNVTWPAKSPPIRKTSSFDPWAGNAIPAAKPFLLSGDEQGTTAGNEPGSPKERRQRVIKRKVQTVGKLGVMANNSGKERKAKDQKEKRQRQEALQRKITSEPLPDHVCEREWVSTWVSPVMRRVASEPDRLLLRKPERDQRQLKMEQLEHFLTMPSIWQPSSKDGNHSALNRASSAPSGQPSIGRNQSRGGQSQEDGVPPGSAGALTRAVSRGSVQSGSRGVKASSWGPVTAGLPSDQDLGNASMGGKARSAAAAETNMLSQMRSAVLNGPTMGNWQQAGETRAVGGSREMVLPARSLPRVASAGGQAAGPTGANNPTCLLLEPPRSLSHPTVIGRFEENGRAFQLTTFAEYVKENDIMTGLPKTRFDEKSLKTAEALALKKADNLGLREPPKRQLRLNQGLRRS